jgi:hypothetical protein
MFEPCFFINNIEENIMKPTYLYIKKHEKTGLMYFGKTTRENPFSYKGSGRHWKRHLNVHGREYVNTKWVSEIFTDKEDIVEFAEFFSSFFDIVKSKLWANEKGENGLDGGRDAGFKGPVIGIEARKVASERMQVDNPMFKDDIRKKHKDKINSFEVREKKSKSKKGNTNVRGKSWYNDGINCFLLFEKDVPVEYKKGRLSPHWNHKRKKNG